MKLPAKSAKKTVDLQDLYAVKLASIWQGAREQHFSLWALIAYFFFEYVRLQSTYPVIDVLPWSQLTLLAAIAGAFADRSVKWVSCFENKFFIFFFLIVSLSGILAFNPATSWEGRTIILNWILVYFLVITIVNTEKRMFLFLLAYMLFNFKMSQHGFMSWAGRGFSFASFGLIGAPGWFRNPGEFAVQMVIFGSLSASFVVGLKDSWGRGVKWGRVKRWFFYLMPFTAVMVVLGANSRGSQLALLVVAVFLMIRLKAGIKVITLVAAIVFSGYHLLPEEQMQRFSAMGDDGTSQTRLAYWDYGFQLIKKYPVLGIGYENWMIYAHFDRPSGVWDGRTELPHNIYIEIAAESGLLAFLMFLLLVLGAFILSYRSRKMALQVNHKFYYFLSYGLDMGLIGYLVAGAFVTIFYYPYFWVQIAFIVALHNITKNLVAQGGALSNMK